MNNNIFHHYLSGKRVAILGFGKEGISSYRFIRRMANDFPLIICDKNPQLVSTAGYLSDDNYVSLFSGETYLEGLENADLIIRSPGISFLNLRGRNIKGRFTSQTEIFLEMFGHQVIGVTGTKGKSTTSSLLFHILKQCGKKTLLAGNIGVPPLDLADDIRDDTIVVFELSSHQLENVKVSPAVAVLLNIFQEHLDHYLTYEHYQQAKVNIARWQKPGDFFICNTQNTVVEKAVSSVDFSSTFISTGDVSFENHAVYKGDDLLVVISGKEYLLKNLALNRRLPGEHNLLNIAAASTAALVAGADESGIADAVSSFSGLPHRLEYLGRVNGIDFYNDSIATVPEAAIQALKACPQTQTLILGGYDRGIDYAPFVDALVDSSVENLVLTGMAGKRMLDLLNNHKGSAAKNIFFADDLNKAFLWSVKNTLPGRTCLLSPAAASYDSFKNFEERGDCFRKMVDQFGGLADGSD